MPWSADGPVRGRDPASSPRGRPALPSGAREVALTALKASLRGAFRLTVLKAGSKKIPGGRGKLDVPLGGTAHFWLPVGLNADLDEAMKQAAREGIGFSSASSGCPARWRPRT